MTESQSTKKDCRDKFQDLPIPSPVVKKTALDYGSISFDKEHKLVNDSLVSASKFGLANLSYYAREDLINPPYYKSFGSAPKQVYIRENVAEKLRAVNQNLEPLGIELCLLDGWRPIELQKELWQHFLARAKEHLDNPSEDECIRYAGEYCSNPDRFKIDDSRTWPTHSTGGAIDLLLRSISNKEYLFFGSVFDDASKISYTNHFELNLPTTVSELEAQKNRRILYWSMSEQGFVNYPLEWWHFDLGTQMWAMNSSEANLKAYYGFIELDQ